MKKTHFVKTSHVNDTAYVNHTGIDAVDVLFSQAPLGENNSDGHCHRQGWRYSNCNEIQCPDNYQMCFYSRAVLKSFHKKVREFHQVSETPSQLFKQISESGKQDEFVYQQAYNKCVLTVMFIINGKLVGAFVYSLLTIVYLNSVE